MKKTLIMLALAVSLTAGAQAYLDISFTGGIPSDITLVNGDGEAWKDGIYARLGSDSSLPWVAATLPGHGKCALSPTRSSADVEQDNRVILPAVEIADAEAILRFDARSMHSCLPEKYSVLALPDGADEWISLLDVSNESHQWTTRIIPLRQFAGKTIQLAFAATSLQGFILAIDNIFVGIPQTSDLRFSNETPHYVGVDENSKVKGRIANYGAACSDLTLRLSGFGEEKTILIPEIGVGETIPVEWSVEPALGETTAYTVSADGISSPLASDFTSCSHFPRLQVIDRCSGTWCNNCPVMSLTTQRLMRKYGSQLVIVETHINDRLVNRDYNASWIDGNVFSIPALIPNHELSKISYQLSSSDDFSGSLQNETIGAVCLDVSLSTDGRIVARTESRFAEMLDNSSDRYRVGYLLVTDRHDPENRSYAQSNSAYSFNCEEWYYQPDQIEAEIMYYENVPIEGSTAFGGVAESLPAEINPGEVYEHAFEYSVAEGEDPYEIRVIAMLIDTDTDVVMNAAVAKIDDGSSVPSLGIDRTVASSTEYYDLLGRKLAVPSGICIKRSSEGSKILKLKE